MSYVCSTLEVLEGVQTCVMWVQNVSFVDQIAIDGPTARRLYTEFAKIFGAILFFAIVAKATKLL